MNKIKFYRKPLIISFFVFIGASIIGSLLCYQALNILKNENNNKTNEVAESIKISIINSLNNSNTAIKTLAFIIEKYGIPENFDKISEKLIQSNDFIDIVQIVEKGVITHVYPYEENKSVIGYDILNDPKVNKEAIEAIEKKEIYYAGPIALKQGGFGIIGRYPIFNNDEFIGFSVVIIKLKTLLSAINTTFLNDKYQIQISKINPNTNEREYFLNNDNFNDNNHSIENIPVGNWDIHVKSVENITWKSILDKIIITMLIIVVLTYFTYYRAQLPYNLEIKVHKKTKEMADREYFYKQLTENIGDVVFVLDPEGKPKFVSESVKNVLGYSTEEILQSHELKTLVHDEDKSGSLEKLRECLSKPGETIQGYTSRLKHKDGTWRWYEGTITNLLHDPLINGVVDNFREITDKVEYLKAIENQNEKLQKISWLHSHVVRAPIARMLGLINILKVADKSEIEKEQTFDYIKKSAEELDGIIKDIIDQSEKAKH